MCELKKAPIFLEPQFFNKRWGNGELLGDFGIDLGEVDATLGEVWLVSDHPGRETLLRDDPAGRSLADIMASDGHFILGDGYEAGCSFPLIVKLLMVGGKLSVQVHPDGRSARKLQLSDRGKHEAWWILGAHPQARIYHGLKECYSSAEIAEAIHENRFQDYLRLLIPKQDDFLDIPPGTFHAGGDGLLLLEVQERCDVTLRVYDWGNKDTKLHVEEALEVGLSAQRAQSSALAVASAPFEVNGLELQAGERRSVGDQSRAELFVIARGQVHVQLGRLSWTLRAGEAMLWPALLEAGGITTALGASILQTFPMNR
jgi:mannose-6-phosphate isomerase